MNAYKRRWNLYRLEGTSNFAGACGVYAGVRILLSLTLLAARVSAQTAPPSSETVAVYRAFLHDYMKGGSRTLNLSNRTVPLDLRDAAGFRGCLQGIALESTSLNGSTRNLDALSGDSDVRLVDARAQAAIVKSNDPEGKIFNGTAVEDAVNAAFASGLLTLSNVSFDKHHQYAILRFDFSCGSLCGHFGTVVMQKIHGEWKRTKRNCGGGVS